MLFNSIDFIYIFLPITLFIFWILASFKKNIHNSVIIVFFILASLIFYSYWSFAFAFLMLLSVVVNWIIGEVIVKNPSPYPIKPISIVIGLVFNLSLLGYFKYANFVVDNLNYLGFSFSRFESLILPIGISFYTFTQIGYLVDLYRNSDNKNYPFLKYLLFIIFFPQLIAGPILCHSELIPQFRGLNWRFDSRNLILGMTVFSVGLFKKLVVADTIARWATPVFELADSGVLISFFIAWQGAIAYTLQLYFDFSAYSDMAIGLGKMFNIKLPINFFSPYKALSIVEFWRRWHITLSRFLRDYLYISLGGNRKGEARKYVNLLIVMTLGGFWHGASWNFILWGGLHGFYLCINHGWKKLSKRLAISTVSHLNRLGSWGLTFLAVVVGWVIFRAETFAGAVNILKGMAGLQGIFIPEIYETKLGVIGRLISSLGIKFDASIVEQASVFSGLKGSVTILVLLFLTLSLPNIYQLMANEPLALDIYKNLRHYPRSWFVWQSNAAFSVATAILFVVSISMLFTVKDSEFLYFQF